MLNIEALHSNLDQLITPDTTVETIVKNVVFTEGPLWDQSAQRLLFSDIPADTIYTWSPASGLQVFRQPSGFSNGLTYNPQGELIACEHRTRTISISRGDEPRRVLASTYQGKRLNSPNDVVAARDGSILFSDPIYGLREGLGGPAEAELDFEGVYRLPPGSDQLELLTDSFERPNGLAFSPDEKLLYIADTVRQHIRVFDVQADWKLNGGCIWAELWDDDFQGRPDGIKVDRLGNLFSTGPGGVWIYNSEAQLLGRIYLPEKTSNLAWGDEDLSSLYITSSTHVYRVHTLTSGLSLLDK